MNHQTVYQWLQHSYNLRIVTKDIYEQKSKKIEKQSDRNPR